MLSFPLISLPNIGSLPCKCRAFEATLYYMYIQLKVLGTLNLFSAIAYGVVSVLFGNCFIFSRENGAAIHITCGFSSSSTVMLLLSTLSLFQSICQVIACTLHIPTGNTAHWQARGPSNNASFHPLGSPERMDSW
jgi:hypothetical protein